MIIYLSNLELCMPNEDFSPVCSADTVPRWFFVSAYIFENRMLE